MRKISLVILVLFILTLSVTAECPPDCTEQEVEQNFKDWPPEKKQEWLADENNWDSPNFESHAEKFLEGKDLVAEKDRKIALGYLKKTQFAGNERAVEIGDNYFSQARNINPETVQIATEFFKEKWKAPYVFEDTMGIVYNKESGQLVKDGVTIVLEQYQQVGGKNQNLRKIRAVPGGFCILTEQDSCLSSEVEGKVDYDSETGQLVFEDASGNKQQFTPATENINVQIGSDGRVVVSGKADGKVFVGGKPYTFDNRRGVLTIYPNGNFRADNAELFTPQLYVDGAVDYDASNKVAKVWDHGDFALGNVKGGRTVLIYQSPPDRPGVISQGQDGSSTFVEVHIDKVSGTSSFKDQDDISIPSDPKQGLEEARKKARQLKAATGDLGGNAQVYFGRNKAGEIVVEAKGKVKVGFFRGKYMKKTSPSCTGKSGVGECELKVGSSGVRTFLRGPMKYSDREYGKIDLAVDGATMSLKRAPGQDNFIFSDCKQCSDGKAMSFGKRVGIVEGTETYTSGVDYTVEMVVKDGKFSLNEDPRLLQRLQQGGGASMVLSTNMNIELLPDADGNKVTYRLSKNQEHGKIQAVQVIKDTQGNEKVRQTNFNLPIVAGERIFLTSEDNVEGIRRFTQLLQGGKFKELAALKFTDQERVREFLLQETRIDIALLDDPNYLKQLDKVMGRYLKLRAKGDKLKARMEAKYEGVVLDNRGICRTKQCTEAFEKSVGERGKLGYEYTAGQVFLLEAETQLLTAQREVLEKCSKPCEKELAELDSDIKKNKKSVRKLRKYRKEALGVKGPAEPKETSTQQGYRGQADRGLELTVQAETAVDLANINSDLAGMLNKAKHTRAQMGKIEEGSPAKATSNDYMAFAYAGKNPAQMDQVRDEARQARNNERRKKDAEIAELEKQIQENDGTIAAMVGSSMDDPEQAANVAAAAGRTEMAREIARKNLDMETAALIAVDTYLQDAQVGSMDSEARLAEYQAAKKDYEEAVREGIPLAEPAVPEALMDEHTSLMLAGREAARLKETPGVSKHTVIDADTLLVDHMIYNTQLELRPVEEKQRAKEREIANRFDINYGLDSDIREADTIIQNLESRTIPLTEEEKKELAEAREEKREALAKKVEGPSTWDYVRHNVWDNSMNFMDYFGEYYGGKVARGVLAVSGGDAEAGETSFFSLDSEFQRLRDEERMEHGWAELQKKRMVLQDRLRRLRDSREEVVSGEIDITDVIQRVEKVQRRVSPEELAVINSQIQEADQVISSLQGQKLSDEQKEQLAQAQVKKKNAELAKYEQRSMLSDDDTWTVLREGVQGHTISREARAIADMSRIREDLAAADGKLSAIAPQLEAHLEMYGSSEGEEAIGTTRIAAALTKELEYEIVKGLASRGFVDQWGDMAIAVSSVDNFIPFVGAAKLASVAGKARKVKLAVDAMKASRAAVKARAVATAAARGARAAALSGPGKVAGKVAGATWRAAKGTAKVITAPLWIPGKGAKFVYKHAAQALQRPGQLASDLVSTASSGLDEATQALDVARTHAKNADEIADARKAVDAAEDALRKAGARGNGAAVGRAQDNLDSTKLLLEEAWETGTSSKRILKLEAKLASAEKHLAQIKGLDNADEVATLQKQVDNARAALETVEQAADNAAEIAEAAGGVAKHQAELQQAQKIRAGLGDANLGFLNKERFISGSGERMREWRDASGELVRAVQRGDADEAARLADNVNDAGDAFRETLWHGENSVVSRLFTSRQSRIEKALRSADSVERVELVASKAKLAENARRLQSDVDRLEEFGGNAHLVAEGDEVSVVADLKNVPPEKRGEAEHILSSIKQNLAENTDLGVREQILDVDTLPIARGLDEAEAATPASRGREAMESLAAQRQTADTEGVALVPQTAQRQVAESASLQPTMAREIAQRELTANTPSTKAVVDHLIDNNLPVDSDLLLARARALEEGDMAEVLRIDAQALAAPVEDTTAALANQMVRSRGDVPTQVVATDSGIQIVSKKGDDLSVIHLDADVTPEMRRHVQEVVDSAGDVDGVSLAQRCQRVLCPRQAAVGAAVSAASCPLRGVGVAEFSPCLASKEADIGKLMLGKAKRAATEGDFSGVVRVTEKDVAKAPFRNDIPLEDRLAIIARGSSKNYDALVGPRSMGGVFEEGITGMRQPRQLPGPSTADEIPLSVDDIEVVGGTGPPPLPSQADEIPLGIDDIEEVGRIQPPALPTGAGYSSRSEILDDVRSFTGWLEEQDFNWAVSGSGSIAEELAKRGQRTGDADLLIGNNWEDLDRMLETRAAKSRKLRNERVRELEEQGVLKSKAHSIVDQELAVMEGTLEKIGIKGYEPMKYNPYDAGIGVGYESDAKGLVTLMNGQEIDLISGFGYRITDQAAIDRGFFEVAPGVVVDVVPTPDGRGHRVVLFDLDDAGNPTISKFFEEGEEGVNFMTTDALRAKYTFEKRADRLALLDEIDEGVVPLSAEDMFDVRSLESGPARPPATIPDRIWVSDIDNQATIDFLTENGFVNPDGTVVLRRPEPKASKSLKDQVGTDLEGTIIDDLNLYQATKVMDSHGNWWYLKLGLDGGFEQKIGTVYSMRDTVRRHKAMENILRNIFGLPVPETRILRTADGLTIMASPALDSYTSLEKGEVPELLAQFVANNGLGPEDAARLQREADLYTALHAKFRIGDAELGVAYFDGIPHIVSVDNEVALAGMRVGEKRNVLLHDMMGVRDETEVISNDRVFGSRRKGRYFGEVNEIDRELFESDFADHIAMIGDRVDGPDGAQRMRKELLDAGYSKSEVDTLVRDIQDVDVRHDLETIVRGNGEAVVSADGKLRTKSDYIAFRETDEGDLLFRKHRNEVVAEARQLEGEAKVRKAAEFPVDETGAVQRNVVNSEMMDPCPIAGRATGMAMPCGLGVSPGNLKGRRVSIQSVEGGSINGEYMGQMGDQLYLRLDNGNVRVLDTNQLDIHSMEEVPLPKQDTMVEVRTADGPLRGKFQGVDEENGLLFVEVNGEVRIFDEQEVAFASLRELPSKSKVAAKIAKNRLTGQTYVGQGPRKVVFNPQNIKKSGLDLGEGETLVAMHIDGQTGEVRLLDPTRTSSASVKDGDIVTKVKVNNRGRIIEVEGTRISRAGQLEKVAEGSDFGEYVKSTAREFNEEFFPSSRIPPARTSDVANIQSGKRGYTAVGDLHGSYDNLMDDLNFDPDNPLIRGDPDDIDSWQWTGGDAVIVQSGDIYDRGPDSLAIREAMNKLDGQARRQGGRVVRLMGNHELGFVDGSPFISMSEVNEIIESGRDVRAYIDMVRGHILEDVKEGRIVAATVVNGELFTHAGVSFRKFPEFRGLSPQGVAEEINRRFVRAMESGDFSDPIFDIGITGRLGEEGVAQIKANPALLDDPENIGGVFWVRRAETKDLQDFNPAKHRKRGYAQYTGHEAKRTKDVQGIEVVDLGDDAFGNPVKLGNLDVGRTKAYGGGKGRLSRSGDDAFENLMDRGLIRDEGIPTTQQRAGEGSVVNGELINPDVAQPCVRVVGGAIHGFAVGCPVGYWDPGDEFPITTLAEARAESVVRSDPADVSHLVSLVGTESERLGVDLRWGADIDPAVVARMDPEIKQTIYEAFRANPEETLRKLDPELVDEVLAERGIDLLDYLEAAEDFVPVPLLEDVREGRVARKVIPASGDEAELRAAIGTLEEARGRVAREGLPKREVQSDLPIDDDHLEVESFAGYRERVAREGLPEVEVLYGEERFRVATLDEVRAERQRPQVELSGCPFIGRAIGGCQGRGTVGGVACEKTDGVGWRRLDGEEITLEQVVALESTDSGVDLFAGGGRLPADAVGGIDPTVRTAIADAFRDDPISVSGKVNNNILGKMGLGGREEFESALREQGRVAALLDQALQDGFSVGIHPGTGEITSGTRGAQYINGRYGVVVDDSAGITTVLYESGGQIHVAEKGMFFDDFDGRSLVSRLNDDPQVQSDLERIASGLEMRGGRELRSDMGIISEIRKMHGRDAPRYEGFFPEDVLEENREAYRQLRRAMAEDPPDAIFTIERGGGFIGESLVEGTVFADKLSKVPKFRPGSTRVGVDVPDLDLLRENIQKSIDSGSTTIFISNSYGSGVFNGGDLKSQVIDPLLRENPGVKLDLEVRDYEYFRQKLQEKIDAGETKLAITDTYFGGRFSRELRSKVVKPLLRSNPDIEIDIYWMRETFGFEPLSAEGMPTLTPFQGSIKPTSPYASRVEVHEARTRVVLGDDMDLIFDGSDDPLVIFDSEGKVERLVRPETTSREALVNLLTEGSEQSN